jgi:hypothetical protein
MEYLVTALRGIIGSNVPFCGAVGALSRDVEMSRDKRGKWTVGGIIIAVVGVFVFWPSSIFIGGVSVISGYGWYKKACEYQTVQESK